MLEVSPVPGLLVILELVPIEIAGESEKERERFAVTTPRPRLILASGDVCVESCSSFLAQFSSIRGCSYSSLTTLCSVGGPFKAGVPSRRSLTTSHTVSRAVGVGQMRSCC